jgi:hypothetical protein
LETGETNDEEQVLPGTTKYTASDGKRVGWCGAHFIATMLRKYATKPARLLLMARLSPVRPRTPVTESVNRGTSIKIVYN